MNCEKVSLMIEDFHDGLLDSPSRNYLEEHLSICPGCSAESEQFQALDKLLQYSCVPLPSPALREGLLEAFHLHHGSPAKTIPWWKRAFATSVNVPLPALGAAIILIMVAVIGANIVGRNASTFNAAINSSSPAVAAPLTETPPQTIVQTKIVEVPVIRERVITRVVYTERKNQSDLKVKNQTGIQEIKAPGSKTSARNTPALNDQIAAGIFLDGSTGKNSYFTQTNLREFQPTSEMKARIVREVRSDEK